MLLFSIAPKAFRSSKAERADGVSTECDLSLAAKIGRVRNLGE